MLLPTLLTAVVASTHGMELRLNGTRVSPGPEVFTVGIEMGPETLDRLNRQLEKAPVSFVVTIPPGVMSNNDTERENNDTSLLKVELDISLDSNGTSLLHRLSEKGPVALEVTLAQGEFLKRPENSTAVSAEVTTTTQPVVISVDTEKPEEKVTMGAEAAVSLERPLSLYVDWAQSEMRAVIAMTAATVLAALIVFISVSLVMYCAFRCSERRQKEDKTKV